MAGRGGSWPGSLLCVGLAGGADGQLANVGWPQLGQLSSAARGKASRERGGPGGRFQVTCQQTSYCLTQIADSAPLRRVKKDMEEKKGKTWATQEAVEAIVLLGLLRKMCQELGMRDLGRC